MHWNGIKRIATACALASVMACSMRAGAAPKAFTDAEVKAILKDRVDRAKSNVGIVIGLIDDKGTRVIAYGRPGLDSDRTLDGDSVFEIGSITKLFTDAILTNMVEHGEVAFTDPISKYLPKTVKTPVVKGKEITLLHLASHTSGLPRNPSNMTPGDIQDPESDYSVEQMYAFLSSFEWSRGIGAKHEYSNFGVGLLGHVLVLQTGQDYENLVRTRISEPLRMSDTAIVMTSRMKTHLAQGHNELGMPVASQYMPTLAGAGALRSTVNDLLKFLAVNLDLTASPLKNTLQTMHQPIHDEMYYIPCIGWMLRRNLESEIFYHTGSMMGYRSFLGFDKGKRQGVVILSNSLGEIADIGMHLLANEVYPLKKLETFEKRTSIKLDPKVFDMYVGNFQLAPNFNLTFSREGTKFFARVGRGDKFEIFPETSTDFFRDGVDAQVTFARNASGQVTHVVVHQRTGDHIAMKLE